MIYKCGWVIHKGL